MTSTSTRLRAEMAMIAAEAGSVSQRADALLGTLQQAVPDTAAWLAVRDPETRVHRRVAGRGDTAPLLRYFALPHADDEVEQLGLNRCQRPVPASALPVPLAETLAWGDYLLPAGFRDGVAMGVFSDDGRHLGFLSVLSADPAHDPASYVDVLAGLQPIIAEALDRLPSFAAAARLTDDAIGGTVITRTGRCVRVPGLPTHPLLADGSPTLTVARRYAQAPGAASTFLSRSDRALRRVSVLDCRDETADHLCALALVRPAGAAADLRLPEVRLLGALVEGWDDDRVRAGLGVSDPGRAAEELARRLALPSTEALVQHAARDGLHLPPQLW